MKLAAELYYGFEQTHPFDDGNGRIGRVLIAYWLHAHTGLSFTFKLKDKLEHLKALESANLSEFAPLVQFFEKRVRAEKIEK